MPGLFMNEHLPAMCPADLETFPFLGQPVASGFGWFVHDDTSTHLQLPCP